MSDHTWECPCGGFIAKLKGPPVFDFNCHCHSCVAPARYLDGKFSSARSALVNGGVGKVFWLLENIELPADGLAFLKVGEGGENIRSYTACCGTLFNSAGGKQFSVPARPLTRNNVKAADGSAYVPADPKQCTDCLTQYAFGDYTLPEPHFEGMSDALQAGFGLCGGAAVPDEIDPRWLKGGEDVSEVVPITWEEEQASEPTPTAEEGVPDAAAELTPQTSVSRVYCVTGHPDPSYNGEYQRLGTWNERPAYRLVPKATKDSAEVARCLYYWRADIPESDEEDAEGEAAAAEDAEPTDFGAGWTFGTLKSLGAPPDSSALVRTKSVAQPPSLCRGDGGCTAEPFVSKMFPPEGAVSFVTTGDAQVCAVSIERVGAAPAAVAEDTSAK